MKKLTYSLLSIAFLSASDLVFAVDCASQNPQGPQAILECIASNHGQTAEEYWNNILFSSASALDKFCQTSLSDNATQAQKEMYAVSCNFQKVVTFLMLILLQQIKQCVSNLVIVILSYVVMTIQLTLKNFQTLATLAQETTGMIRGMKNQNDGLYFRYENGALGSTSCYDYASNPTDKSGTTGSNCASLGLSSYKTGYYPKSSYVVAVDSTTPNNVYTGYVLTVMVNIC